MITTHFVGQDTVLAFGPGVCKPVKTGQLERLELASYFDVFRVFSDLGISRTAVDWIRCGSGWYSVPGLTFVEGINGFLRSQANFVIHYLDQYCS